MEIIYLEIITTGEQESKDVVRGLGERKEVSELMKLLNRGESFTQDC